MPVFEAAHAEVDGSGKLQQYRAINMKKKKIDSDGLEKGAIDVKKWMKNQPLVPNGPL